MKLLTVHASSGIRWVRQGFQTFGRQPLAFASLFALFLFALFVLGLVPGAGSFLLLAALPLGSLGFMIAAHTALRGQRPFPNVFIAPLRAEPDGQRRRAWVMLQFGLIYAVASFAIAVLANWVDGGALEALFDALAKGSGAGGPDGASAPAITPQEIAQHLANPALLWGMVVRLLLAALLSVPFWHGPALAYWDRQGVTQALFSSTVACWCNRGAFTLFGLGWAAVVIVCAVIANLAAALLGSPQLVAFLMMPLTLLLSAVFYVSTYFSFAACFAPSDSVTQEVRPFDSQLP